MAKRKKPKTTKAVLPVKKKAKTKNKQTKKTLVVFTRKKKNKLIEGLTTEQRLFWNERIFSDENVANVANADPRNKIRKLKGVRSNTLSDREKMIGNIIADVI